MLSVSLGDDSLNALLGADLPSAFYADVTYRLTRRLGTGSMAVAFLAERRSPAGKGVAVLKFTRPDFVRQSAEMALLSIRKESVALGRLNERVPPTPFVVRFIENGETRIDYGGKALTLPWLAMEYVHGNTLEDRINDQLEQTRHAFEPERAALCIESMASGIDAVHSVDVLHRDIKPNNVLCCGAFPDEVFKLSDFGVARPVGLKQTFMQGSMGTPGFASPEQILMDEEQIGPASDVFSFAATTFALLTGEELFDAPHVMQLVEQMRGRERRSVTDCRGLSETLKKSPKACAAIDSAIAHATAPDSRDRPQTASIFARTLLAALKPDSVRSPVAAPISARGTPRRSLRPAVNWNWNVRHSPGDSRALLSVAWDGTGSCLAATTEGVSYWNGTEWSPADLEPAMSRRVRFVHHVGPGLWLLAGSSGLLAYYAAAEGPQRLRVPKTTARFEAVNGVVEDLAVVVASDEGHPPLLHGVCGKRWLKPLPATGADFLLDLARYDDERWLVVGRGRGQGYAALYSPLGWQLDPLPVPKVRSFTGCATAAEACVAVVVGAEGQTFRLSPRGLSPCKVPGDPDLSAVVLELNQRAWTTSLGCIWVQTPQSPDTWQCAWKDDSWHVPIVSLFADGRRVIGVAADGAVIEGCEY